MWVRIIDAIGCALFPSIVIWAFATAAWRGDPIEFDDPEHERDDW